MSVSIYIHSYFNEYDKRGACGMKCKDGSSGSKKERLLKLEKPYTSIVATYQIIDKIDSRFLVHDKC